mmetsp:Transcript_100148/g.283648  ORF Transcript_100148/g.283648 Transcript_100148/m.283648 type:complete len:274 (+) Transcript_100148:414-1235(+)
MRRDPVLDHRRRGQGLRPARYRLRRVPRQHCRRVLRAGRGRGPAEDDRPESTGCARRTARPGRVAGPGARGRGPAGVRRHCACGHDRAREQRHADERVGSHGGGGRAGQDRREDQRGVHVPPQHGLRGHEPGRGQRPGRGRGHGHAHAGWPDSKAPEAPGRDPEREPAAEVDQPARHVHRGRLPRSGDCCDAHVLPLEVPEPHDPLRGRRRAVPARHLRDQGPHPGCVADPPRPALHRHGHAARGLAPDVQAECDRDKAVYSRLSGGHNRDLH